MMDVVVVCDQVTLHGKAEGIFAGVIKVPNQLILSSSKDRLSWEGLPYSDEPFKRGFRGQRDALQQRGSPAGFAEANIHVNCFWRGLRESDPQ